MGGVKRGEDMKARKEKATTYRKRMDRVLLLLCIVTSLIGLVLLYSIYAGGELQSIRTVYTQCIATGIGIIAALILSRIDYHTIADLWKIHLPVTVVLTLLTFTPLGIAREGADDRAWLGVGSVTFQPSELLKLSFIFTLAVHLAYLRERDDLNRPKNILLLLCHAALPTGLVALQGDFGSAVVFFGIFIIMLFAAGLSFRYIIGGLCAAIPLGLIGWFFVLQDFHRERILIAFSPERDPLGRGYQQMQGRLALASGQLFGKGLFPDEQLVYVPEMYNDFIFSYIGQTAGFVGCAVTVALLAAILLKTLWIAKNAKDPLGCYLCIGVFAALFIQIVINIGMVLCVMPVIGVTLPLLSSGGSSVIMVYLCIGVVLNVSLRVVRKGTTSRS